MSDRVGTALIKKCYESRVPAATISDAMGRFGAIGRGISSLSGDDVYLAGSAFTVRTAPADNLLVHKALDMAQPGDVILIDAGGDTSHAIVGELMIRHAEKRGVRGIIVDGCVRDGAAIRKMGYPVYAKGLTPLGPYKEGPGEINIPIGCGGVAVCPGDLIVGDADGIVVIPSKHAKQILERAFDIQEGEVEIIRKIANEEWERDWIDEKLKDKGML